VFLSLLLHTHPSHNLNYYMKPIHNLSNTGGHGSTDVRLKTKIRLCIYDLNQIVCLVFEQIFFRANARINGRANFSRKCPHLRAGKNKKKSETFRDCVSYNNMEVKLFHSSELCYE
jgi:hypothetical protein